MNTHLPHLAAALVVLVTFAPVSSALAEGFDQHDLDMQWQMVAELGFDYKNGEDLYFGQLNQRGRAPDFELGTDEAALCLVMDNEGSVYVHQEAGLIWGSVPVEYILPSGTKISIPIDKESGGELIPFEVEGVDENYVLVDISFSSWMELGFEGCKNEATNENILNFKHSFRLLPEQVVSGLLKTSTLNSPN